uniref:Lysosomal alpha-glucosidase n=1 Tax=Culex pipiens TaxID=7175 RepID=A0A8D8F4U0_CULPI
MPPPLRQREPTEDTDINEVDFPEFDKRPAFIHVLLLNKTIRLFFVLGVAAIVIPAFAYLFFFSQEIGHAPRQLLTGTCGHPTLYHIQCGFPNSTKEECHNLGCCYTSLSTCYHSLPSEHQYQSVQSEWRNGTLLTPTRNQTPYHKPASPKIFIHLKVLNQSRIQLTLDTTANQPDTTSSDQPISTVSAGDLQAKIYSPTFFVEVSNVTAGEIIFSTARGPLIVTENFFEWTLHLGVDSMFGLGEAVLEPGRKYLLFNSQNASAVPAVMGYNLQSQQYNGVVFTTPGLTEIEIVRSRLIVVRSQFTGSFQLELLSGPSPADLHRQLKTINQNQYRPPFWAYGVHVCDHGRNVSLRTVREDIQRMIDFGVMFDSHCINDDLFWLSDPPAIGGELEQTILLLKGSGKRFVMPVVMVLEPTGGSVAYKNATNADLLLRSSSKLGSYRGVVRNRTVTYVDWRSERLELGGWMHDAWSYIANLNADGYSLKETALRDDGNKTYPTRDELTYLPDGLNSSLEEVVNWDVRYPGNREMIVKSQNRLGPEAVQAVQRVIREDQLLITGTYNMQTKAAIIAQNVSATWIALRNEVNRAIGLSVAGITFIGTPICGNARDNVTEELCIRWYQFGSLLPLFKVSSDRTANRFSKFAERIMHATIRNRFALIEYFNSLIVTDSAYLRPMFYHYEEARNYTAELWEQFMIGDSLLVVPVLLPQMAQIDIYFPEKFYELWAGEELPQTKDRPLSYTVVESDLPIFIRPGRIVALREVLADLISVDDVRQQPMHLIGAFTCPRTTSCTSTGSLVFVEGFEVRFHANLNETSILVEYELNSSNNNSAVELICSGNFSGQINYLQLYGRPTSSEPLVRDLQFDLCQSTQMETTALFTLLDEKNPD